MFGSKTLKSKHCLIESQEMSLDLVLRETTPNEESSHPLSQSNDSKQDLALTLNQSNSDINTTITSIASNTSNEMNTSNASDDASKEQNSQIRDTKDSKSEHREDVKRRRTRRARKRKWHRIDYRSKRFQWSESTEQEVRRLHMKVVEHGQPLAPYNTTQFIMNEHNCDKEIDFDAIRGKFQRMKRSDDNDQSGTANDPNDEDFYSSPEDESDYLQQQFHEAYDNIHAERLSAMNKNELVQEYLQLEDRVEDLERRLKESTNAQTMRSLMRTTYNSEVQTELCSEAHHSGSQSDGQITSGTDDFQGVIKTLTEENESLRRDNERLHLILSEHHISGDLQKWVPSDPLEEGLKEQMMS